MITIIKKSGNFNMKGFEKEYKKNKINEQRNLSKEQILNQAFKLHREGKISEAIKFYQYFLNQGFKDHRLFFSRTSL